MASTMDAGALNRLINRKFSNDDTSIDQSQYHRAFRKQLKKHPNDTCFLVDLKDRVITCTENECWEDIQFEFDEDDSIDFSPFVEHITNSEHSEKHALARDTRIAMENSRREQSRSQPAPPAQADNKPSPSALNASASSSEVKPFADVKPLRKFERSSSLGEPFSSSHKRGSADGTSQSSSKKKVRVIDLTGSSPVPSRSLSPVAPTPEQLTQLELEQHLAQVQLDAINSLPSQFNNANLDAQRKNFEQALVQAKAKVDRARDAQGRINVVAPIPAEETPEPVAGPGPATMAFAQAAAADKEAQPAQDSNEVVDAARMSLDPPQANDQDESSEGEGQHERRRDDRRARAAQHVASMDSWFKKAAEEEMFEDNVTVDDAVRKLGLSGSDDRLENCKFTLMPHQVIGVAWMLEREKSEPYGGILGDEMGLGKTIQTIALMAKHESTDPKEKTTLIVAPLSLLCQWGEEIEDKMEEDYFHVFVYHGDARNNIRSARRLRRYDVVLTTYDTLVQEFEDDEAAKKAPVDADPDAHVDRKREPGLLFKVDWFRVVLDEGHTIRNKDIKASRAVAKFKSVYRWVLTGTLIVNKHDDVFPLLRFLQLKPWFNWDYFRYHIVPSKDASPNELDKYSNKLNVVLRTVHLRRKKNSKLNGEPLLKVPPKTIDLHELDFTAEERQIYNQVERHAQVRFNRFLKAGTVLTNYTQVLAMLLRLRQICFHPCLIAAEHNPRYQRRLKREENEKALELIGRKAVDKLKKMRLDQAIDRIEAEEDGDSDAGVEADECALCGESATEAEGGAVITRCRHIFCKGCLKKEFAQSDDDSDDDDDFLEPRRAKDKRACPACDRLISVEEVFALSAFEPGISDIKKIKPELAMSDSESEAEATDDESLDDESLDDDDDDESDSDSDSERDSTSSDDDDVEIVRPPQKGKAKGRSREPLFFDSDDDEVEIVDPHPVKPARDRRASPERRKAKGKRKVQIVPKTWQDEQEPSTKMRWALAEVKRIEREFPDDKIIIISQWTSVLGMMNSYLNKHGHSCSRYQGDMNHHDRDKSQGRFMEGESRRIMLLSLKVGGAGLNLVRANWVISLDLAWSPAVEAQAFDRVHRIGQEKEVHVDRLTIQDTVEQRIGQLQARKQRIADKSLGEGGGKKVGRLTVAELAGLFGLEPNGKRRLRI